MRRFPRLTINYKVFFPRRGRSFLPNIFKSENYYTNLFCPDFVMTLRQIYPESKSDLGRNTINVIAVHGLDFMDADEKCSNSSWQQPPNTQQPSNTQPTEGWLKAFFQDLSFRDSSWGVRLFLYEYDSIRTFCSSSEDFQKEAKVMLQQLCQPQWSFKDSRIIFLCQGLGGVMIKQALVHASAESIYSEIKHATSGLVFFGTPHKGINQGRTGLLKPIFSNLFRSDARKRLPSLQLDLEPLGSAFRHQVEDYKFVSFYSEKDQIVPFDSAVLNLTGDREAQVRLSANRSDLCCFPIRSDSYEKVTRHLQMLCEEVIQEQSMSN